MNATLEHETGRDSVDCLVRPITSEDVIAASNDAYATGRKHRREEIAEDIARAQRIALKYSTPEGIDQINEAFERIKI
jgi:hypothetical protein